MFVSPYDRIVLCVLLSVYVCSVLVLCDCPSRVFSNSNNPDPQTSYGTPSAQALVLWVTKGAFTAGAFNGGAGLDAMCTSTQPVGTIGSFTHQHQARVAFISNSTTDANQKFRQDIDIVNTKGECLGSNALDAYQSNLAYLILDETGSPLTEDTLSSVWTGSFFENQFGSNPVGGVRAGGNSPAQYCNDWTSNLTDSSSQLPIACQVGTLFPASPPFVASEWFKGDENNACDSLYHFYCISAAAAPTSAPTTPAPTSSNSGGQGDPQFVGLQGQSFQVHGIPDEYFNLLSHPFTQLNSHFTYLATGTCHYNDTLCWSHPGTYVDELGVMLPGVELAVVAGPHSQGLTVTVNGKQLHVSKRLYSNSQTRLSGAGTKTATVGTAVTFTFPIQLDNDTIAMPHNAWLEHDQEDMFTTGPSNGASSSSVPWWSWLSSATCRVSFHSHNRVIITTPVAIIDIYNAEHFFNFQLEFRAPRLLLAGAPVDRVLDSGSSSSVHPAQAKSRDQSLHPQFPMHGLIGQTWKNVRYPHGRLYAGHVDDYMLTDRQLFSTQFHFNEYLY